MNQSLSDVGQVRGDVRLKGEGDGWMRSSRALMPKIVQKETHLSRGRIAWGERSLPTPRMATCTLDHITRAGSALFLKPPSGILWVTWSSF